MARYLFASHDGFGLGHVRRNTLVGRAILRRDPQAEITLVTGLPMRPAWLGDDRLRVVGVPSLLKDSTGAYQHQSLAFEDAIAARAQAFRRAVRDVRPHAVVVDRHPYGIGGELRTGLDEAKAAGAALVLGLRDVLDEPRTVARELAGDGWAGVGERFDAVLVYGQPVMCDHQAEYGLPVAPRYCGWVVETPAPQPREAGLLVVSGGGGGDGAAVFGLGAELAATRQAHGGRVVIVSGPYATHDFGAPDGVEVVAEAAGCVDLFARAQAVVQMAGYNSTFESLAAGIRPILVPRRRPRREQAIRAARLAALGLADVVDEGAPSQEVEWLLRRDRMLAPDALQLAGITLNGADRAAAAIESLVAAAVPTSA
ncbi:MAG TPA: hypothetical protein VFJ97_07935 [Dermatophilaceae bacterium]|nr:hypothetical protein [Dermatophilaceae bacterium]